jgi:very-short-patch-repair endonuclease
MGVGQKTTAYETESAQPPREQRLAILAARQHGVVSLSQLRQLGWSASGVRTRVAAGRLHRVHGGVYAVGHSVLCAEGRWMAAVLACGPRAVLSHQSAAALWGLRPTARSKIDVIAQRRAGRGRAGLSVHRARGLRPRDVTRRRNIPCTTVARTLLDLADAVDRSGLERALEQAEILRLVDLASLQDVLARADGRHGAPMLRAVLADHDPGSALTRSELERRFLKLCRDAALPSPRVNARVRVDGDGFEVDFSWPGRRLIAELDGFGTHGTRAAFERDCRRDRLLQLGGRRVVRFTWRQLVGEPDEIAGYSRREERADRVARR